MMPAPIISSQAKLFSTNPEDSLKALASFPPVRHGSVRDFQDDVVACGMESLRLDFVSIVSVSLTCDPKNPLTLQLKRVEAECGKVNMDKAFQTPEIKIIIDRAFSKVQQASGLLRTIQEGC
jgi:hypothetical protein